MVRQLGPVWLRVYALSLLLVFALLAPSGRASASNPGSTLPSVAPAAKQGPEDEVIVKFRRGTATSDVNAAHSQNNGAVSRSIPQTGAQVVRVTAGDAKNRAAAYKRL